MKSSCSKKMIVSNLVEKFSTRIFIIVFKNSAIAFHPETDEPSQNPHILILIYISVLFSHLHLSPKWTLPSGFPIEITYQHEESNRALYSRLYSAIPWTGHDKFALNKSLQFCVSQTKGSVSVTYVYCR
jgi:hypothetical protein